MLNIEHQISNEKSVRLLSTLYFVQDLTNKPVVIYTVA